MGTSNNESDTDAGSIGAVGFATVREAEVAQSSMRGRPSIASPDIFEGSGLALSGGGIRSATFSLGVLQALASADKLQEFDYLSTVSGGGYIGSWLTSWMARTSPQHVIEALKNNPSNRGVPEPPEVQWLRRYSNYLTPRVGAFSMDALTAALTWLRNAFLNALILTLTISAVLLLAKLLSLEAARIDANPQFPDILWVTAHVLAFLSFSAISFNLTLNDYGETTAPSATDSSPAGYGWTFLLRPTWVWVLAVGAGFLACILASLTLAWTPQPFEVFFPGREYIAAAAVAIGSSLAWLYAKSVERKNAMLAGSQRSATQTAILPFLYALPGAVTFFLLVYLVQRNHLLTLGLEESVAPPVRTVATFGPPVIMVCFGISLCLWIGTVGRGYDETSREWLSRMGAAFVLLCVVWIAWLALANFIPDWVGLLFDPRVGHWFATTLVSGGWLGSLIGALALGLFQAGGKSRSMSKARTYAIAFLFAVVATGIFVAISVGLDWGLKSAAVDTADDAVMATLFACVSGVALYLAWRVDVNLFSLHDMYKMRIIRCYLGASNPERHAQPFTGFDPTDDLPLEDLKNVRPYHIINTSLNLVEGSQLAWQQRKAASFVLTPLYCGFELSQAQGDTHLKPSAMPVNSTDTTRTLTPRHSPVRGFRPTNEYARIDSNNAMAMGMGRVQPRSRQAISIGMAVATSGAAASPNMGANSNPALAILMTFVNIRLGRWSPNPARKRFENTSPHFGLLYLLKELAGLTNENSDFVYLSDGGHFENTGVYELIRRRCRRIVVIDAGADPDRSFEDLGNMIHKCRVDFGVEINLKLTDLFGNRANRSECGYVKASIDYASGIRGDLLVIKPSLRKSRDEAADILHYASSDDTFPQQTTLDQWFNESQFEAYRKLGYDTMMQAIKTSEYWPP